MEKEKLDTMLKAHNKQMSGADLRDANLSYANLSSANLSFADLDGADLSYANLSSAYMNGTNISYANLRGANLKDADLFHADLSHAVLRDADLRNVNLRGANLRYADLSGSIGLLSAIDYMKENFERTSDGYIAYTMFDMLQHVPERWNIERGSVISENVNFDRVFYCGCGINVASREWMRRNYGCNNHDIWKVLIRWEWLCGVCVPYNTDGNIRCERVELVDNHIRLDEVE